MHEVTRLTSRGKMFAGVLLLVCSGIAATALSSSPRPANRRHAPKHADRQAAFVAKPTPGRLARGRYLVETVGGCFECHTVHEYVDGQWVPKKDRKGAGQVYPADFWTLPPSAEVVAPNITPDRQTGIGSWTDAEIEQAIRYGVAKGGRPLFDLMPYWQFRVLSNEDVKSIIVYLRSIRPVHNALPVTKMPFPVHVNMNDALVPPLPKDASPLVRHGWYLVRVAGCADCHTPLLKGGRRPPTLLFAGGMRFHRPFGTVFSTNITFDSSGISFMNEAMFSRTIRTGRVNGTGQQLKPPMPFRDFHNLKASDIHAIYVYLRTVPHVRHNIDNTDPPTYCKIDGEMHGLGDRN